MKRLAFALCLLAAPACAAPVAPQQPTIDPNKPINLTLAAVDVQKTINAISEDAKRKAEDANRIVQSIISQAQAQTAPPAQPNK